MLKSSVSNSEDDEFSLHGDPSSGALNEGFNLRRKMATSIDNPACLIFKEGEECQTTRDQLLTENTDAPNTDYFRRGRARLSELSANIDAKELFEVTKQYPPAPSLLTSGKFDFSSLDSGCSISPGYVVSHTRRTKIQD